MGRAFAHFDHLAGVAYLLRGQLGLPPELHAAPFCRCNSCPCAFDDKRALELGQRRDHVPQQPTRGALGVNCLGQGPEAHAALFEVFQKPDQVRERAPQPVQLPHGEHVSHLEVGKAFVELGSPRGRAADPVGIDTAAPRLLQSGDLQVGVLVVGGDAGIADFHALIFGLNYRTRKRLFFLPSEIVR